MARSNYLKNRYNWECGIWVIKKVIFGLADFRENPLYFHGIFQNFLNCEIIYGLNK